jgi:hypothetical protein
MYPFLRAFDSKGFEVFNDSNKNSLTFGLMQATMQRVKPTHILRQDQYNDAWNAQKCWLVFGRAF